MRKIRKTICLSLALASGLPLSAFAQDKIITGTVRDSKDVIIGASVKVRGSKTGAITDMDGNFKLKVPENAKELVITYVGYTPLTVPIDKNKIEVSLKESANDLNELVVIGYGAVKKSTLTAAVAKMGSEAIADRPLARAESALQGQLAGVTVRTTTGEPGADMQIRVRGAASVNASSDPLYVVDGVPMTTLSGINPSDIASVEVLKDAASAAIYGSRGSNGVVIVSTNKGKTGKPKISFNASYGFQTLEKKMDLLSSVEWMTVRTKYNDALYLQLGEKNGFKASIKDDNATRLANTGFKAGTNDAFRVILDDRWFNYMSQEMRDTHTFTPTSEGLDLLDWQNEMYRTATVQDYNLSVSGGTEHVNYLFSGGYMDQQGLAVGTGYKRFTFRTNVEAKINKYISIGMNLAPTYFVADGSGRANGKDAATHKALGSVPVSEPGVGYNTNIEPNPRYNWAGSTSSPSAELQTNIKQNRNMRLVGNAFVRIKPISDLQIELSAAANYNDLDANTYSFTSVSSKWSSGEGAGSSSGHTTSRSWSTLLQAVANYNHTFGKHGVGGMLGFSSEQTSLGYSTNQAWTGPFPNDQITGSFDASKVPSKTNAVTESTPNKLLSAFGRVQYDFDSRYMLSASLRYDGGSVFGSNNKWGVFPAISAGWLISNEKFFKKLNLSWWNTLKFRASYGVTGNNSISNTAAYATMASISYGGVNGYNGGSIGNPDLGWEKTKSTDIAVDLGFLNNRIQLSLDYYTKKTTDLLYQIPTLGASGFSSTWGNLGDISNKGFELELNTRNLTGEFTWETSFNLSYNTNIVDRLGVDNTPVYSGWRSSDPSNVLMVGKAINTFYMYDAVGVWKTQKEIDNFSAAHGGKAVTFNGKQLKPGDIRYADINGDGVFDENDKTYLGSPTPKFIYGMTNRFSYKNFDLSILLTAQTGGKIYGILGRALDSPMMPNVNMLGNWRNAWWSETEPGDGHTPYIMSSTTQGQMDSRWLYSSDYLRIKNVTLGYKIPLKSKFISYARVYVSMENLVRWDSYRGGYSPEAANVGSGPGGQSALGLDYGSYPISRMFTFGINLNF